jgi:AraC-like DNA-binding protein
MAITAFDPTNLPVTRSAQAMLDQLRLYNEAPDTVTRTLDGWCRPVFDGIGFRHDYDLNVAKGGWEFYKLGQGLCLAITDMVPALPIPRRHSSADFLVLTAMVDGRIQIARDGSFGASGDMENGFCTIYGLSAGDELATLYEPGRHLRWVSVFIDRLAFSAATGIDAGELPSDMGQFLVDGGRLPHRNVPLSPAASLAVHQLMERPFENGFRRAFLTAKALELACHTLFSLAQSDQGETANFSTADYRKLHAAMRMIRSNLQQPPNVQQLADAVGLSRHRLQLGFRVVYGDTAGRIRDKVRMDLALDLVRDSPMSMIEIALETGYEHAASFTRAFKAAFGVSPQTMRRSAQEELCRKHRWRDADI